MASEKPKKTSSKSKSKKVEGKKPKVEEKSTKPKKVEGKKPKVEKSTKPKKSVDKDRSKAAIKAWKKRKELYGESGMKKKASMSKKIKNKVRDTVSKIKNILKPKSKTKKIKTKKTTKKSK